MQQLNISQRLRTIATYVPEGSRLADIGSDHALLPVYLCQSGHIRSAIAGELNDGPLRAAERQVVKAGLTQKIAVRQGDGLAVINKEEVDAVVIAGMGGSLIRSILEEGLAQLATVHTLVLQPNVGEDTVRRWLFEHGWFLADESIIKEDGRIYEILYAVRKPEALAASEKLYDSADECLTEHVRDWKFRMGPWLLFHNDPLLAEKWLLEREKWARVYEQLALSDTAEAVAKKQQLHKQIEQLEAILQCLQADRPCYS